MISLIRNLTCRPKVSVMGKFVGSAAALSYCENGLKIRFQEHV